MHEAPVTPNGKDMAMARLTRFRARGSRVSAPGAWLLFVLALDLSAGSTFMPAVLYGIAPLMSAALLGPAATAGFGAVALLLTTSSVAKAGDWGTAEAWVPMGNTVLVSTVAVLLSATRVRRETQFTRMVRIAEVAQRAILPVVPRRIGRVLASARYVSAGENSLIGGDLYDWFQSERRVCFIVADVRGKGLGAVEQAARVIRAFRQSAASIPDPAKMAVAMGRYLAPFLDEEEFVTALILQAVGGGRVTLVSCGHPPPLRVGSHDGVSLIALQPGLPLGLGERYEAVTVPWSPGDRFLLYTDGLSEARNANGEFLPVESLGELIRRAPHSVALDDVLRRLRQHVQGGHLTDDLAMVLLENSEEDGPAPQATLVGLDRPGSGGGRPAG